MRWGDCLDLSGARRCVRLSPVVTSNCSCAPVLLVQEGEIDRGTVREILGANLRREYQLDKQTARRTLVTRIKLDEMNV